MEIWDTAGQERYRSLVKFFYKNAKGALLVFDLGDRESFHNLDFWLKSVKTNSDKDLAIFIIGNKCDRNEQRQVKETEIKEFCKINEVQFFETSAKENIQISFVFEELAKKIKEKIDANGGFSSSFCDSESQENLEMKMEKGCTICEC